MSSSIGLVRSGQLLPLAVSTMRRSPALPDVRTTTEVGFPHTDYTFWTDCSRRRRRRHRALARGSRRAITQSAVQAKFTPQGVDPLPLSPKEFDAMIAKEIASNIELAKAAGLKFN